MIDIKIDCVERDDIRDAIYDLQEKKYPTRFKFTNITNGIRPGAFSVLLGTAGSGKSTLQKALLSDISKEHQVLVWLSEEERKQYSIDLEHSEGGVNLKNIKFIEEKNFRGAIQKISSYEQIVDIFRRAIKKYMFGIMFVDNITTSALFDNRKPDVQANLIYALRDLSCEENVAIFCLAHTQKNINSSINRLIMQEDIQGSSSTTKASQFFYIMHQIECGNKKENIIQITKHRGFTPTDKFFHLVFNGQCYTKDREIPFETVKEIWSKRNKL